jgi:hypothetical protein
MNIGSRLWIISEEISINILTKPNAQTLLGICRQIGFAPECVMGALFCCSFKGNHSV